MFDGLFLQFHWLPAAVERAVTTPGHDKLGTALLTHVSFAYLIGHYCSNLPGHFNTGVFRLQRLGLAVLFAELIPQHFTYLITGQGINEDYRPGALETSQPGATVLDNLLPGGRLPFLEDDDS